MPEPHAGAELEQTGLGCWRGSCSSDSELFGRSPHQQRFADRIGRRKLHKAPGLGRKSIEPPPKLSSIRPDSATAPGRANPNPPANSAGVNPLRSSNDARGYRASH
jgi:hypothetical protein